MITRRLFLLSCAVLMQVQGAIPLLTETVAEQEERLKWFRDAKFGLFIHWGPAAISGEEISWGMMDRIEGGDKHKVVPREEYMNLYKEFNPTKFDADEVLSLAKQAGMKYIVFVTKHHDGFSLWETKQNRFPVGADYPEKYSISDAPYAKDIVKEVQEATLRHGLKLGWYYSTRDWTHPEYLQGDNAIYNEYYENQVEELLGEYGPVDMLWFDHCFGKWDQYTIPTLYEKIYSHNPEILINNRAARGLPDIPAEYDALAHADYDTPENRMGSFQHGRAWESCMILSPSPDHGGWSYRPNGVTRSLDETIKLLSSCVCGDGNMLLNLAPLPDGSLKPEEVQILKGIVPWVEKYGEAVYETRGGPWVNGAWGGATYKGNAIYLHLFGSSGSITLNALPGHEIVSATTVDGKPVSLKQEAGTITVSLPEGSIDEHVSIVKLTTREPITEVYYGPALASESSNVVPGTMSFPLEEARLNGGLTLKKDAIQNWSDPQAAIRWPLEIDSPGKYKIQLTTSCAKPGSVITAYFGKTIGAKYGAIPITGSLDQYQTYILDEVYFPNAESTTLTLKPGHPHAWKEVNLQSIKLIPVN